ncbi:MAG: hypothetical protein ABIT38_06055 [Gemmatimonadaceae bacterium]
MLAYLDALCTALSNRDALAIAELLRHPLASALPPAVLEESQRIAAAATDDHIAPVQTLRLYHQTAHLLGACNDPASRNRVMPIARAASDRPRQMEFDFPMPAAAVA